MTALDALGLPEDIDRRVHEAGLRYLEAASRPQSSRSDVARATAQFVFSMIDAYDARIIGPRGHDLTVALWESWLRFPDVPQVDEATS